MKKITMSFRWVSWMLIGMGLMFGAIGGIVGLAVHQTGAIEPDYMMMFQIWFTGTFVATGILQIIAGVVVMCAMNARVRTAQRLMQSGEQVWAEVVDAGGSYAMTYRGVHTMRQATILRCKYTHTDGKAYIFKSPHLRYNPTNLLTDGKVKVWFDRNDITKYYVDVDGSIGGDVVEL